MEFRLRTSFGGFHRASLFLWGLSSEIHSNEERSAFHRDSYGRWYWGAMILTFNFLHIIPEP